MMLYKSDYQKREEDRRRRVEIVASVVVSASLIALGYAGLYWLSMNVWVV